YADTALNGEAAPTRCGHAFFGTAHCLFASDAPFDAEQGRGLIDKTIRAVEALEITEGERSRIFAGNAAAMLKPDPAAASLKPRTPACSCATARWALISRSRIARLR